MCHSEKGDFKVFKKFYMQKMLREYWRGGGAGRKSCDEEETVREFTYLGDRVSAGGVYEAASTARVRCGG